MRNCLALLMINLSSMAYAMPQAENLPDDFVHAQPRVQLYMAYAEYKMANYGLAHDMWQNIHGKGRAEALFNLGILYEQGKGVDKSLSQAKDYYLSAAAHGSRAAAYQVGLMALEYPELISEQLARQWLTVAALDGDEDASRLLESLQHNEGATDDPLISVQRLLMRGEIEQALEQLKSLTKPPKPEYNAVTELAWLYETGLAVERDLNKAASLFEQAAKAGIPKAQYSLAVMYATGSGKEKDTELADYWLNKSADNGYKPAIKKLNVQ